VSKVQGTEVQRAEDARRNEATVLAESSLLGERRVAIVRLAMMGLFGLAREVIAPAFGITFRDDPLRVGAVVLYLVYGVVVAIQIRRLGVTTPARSRWFQLQHATVDFAFIAFIAWRSWVVDQRVHPELGAITGAVLLSYSVARAGLIHVVYSTFLACALFVGVGVGTGAWSPFTGPFVLGGFVALGLLIGFTNHSVHDTFRGLRARDNLSRFLPRQLVDRVLAHGDRALAPVQTEVTVLFSDLRDFTTLSESLAPRALLQLLDEYFGHMSQIVKAHDGIVNKFIGDGMLAIWNVPERSEQHAELALRAALDMRTRLEELNQVRAQKQLPPLRFGVGIHSGSVAAGMLGGADQHEYTVIGDAVNVASRVEGLTKQLGADILVSDATLAHVRNAGFETRALGDQHVKGRAEPIAVHALVGRRVVASAA
jgi:adenylate cyclase